MRDRTLAVAIAIAALFPIVTVAQSPQQLNVLSGTALASGLSLGINTSGGLTNWLTAEPATVAAPGDLKMVCPSQQAWCAMFITDGPALSGFPRPGIDLSGYQTLTVEIQGDPGTTIQVGVKDSTQLDDGNETKVTLPVTSNWTKQTIPVSRFTRANLKSIYVVFEFVFPGGAQQQTLQVRNITYASPNPTTYYFPHLAFGNGWQTTLTYLNYSPQNVSCQTLFYDDSGGSLAVPFAPGSVPSRTDNLAPGAIVRGQTQANISSAQVSGWAVAQCSGPIKASMLFRYYNGSVAQGEAAVNSSTAPALEFVTFAETRTGLAYANPSSAVAVVTIALFDASGARLGSRTLTLQPNAHGEANIGPLLGLNSFTGSVQITSTVPIVSLAINAEAYPVFSTLPPGDLPDGTLLKQ